VASGEHRTCMRWLRAALAAALLIAPNMSARMAAEAPPGAEARVRAAAPATRFSELAEITPGNVSGLMPLVGRSLAVMLHDAQLEPSAAVDRPLERFVGERTDQPELMREERAHPHPTRPHPLEAPGRG